MRVLYNNLVSDATITATNENTSYPVENVYHKYLYKLYKATASTSTVTITWGTDQTVDCLAFAYHNISAVTYTLKNSGGGTIVTDTPTVYDGDIIYLASSHSNVRSIELAFTGSADPFYIGYIGAGVYAQMPGFSAGIPFSNDPKEFRNKSLGGQLSGSSITRLRARAITFLYSTQAEVDTVETFVAAVGRITPFMFDLYEENRDGPMDYPFYCGLASISPYRKENSRGVSYGFTHNFEECN